MLRTLLADRFKVRVHTETKEQQVYALVLAATLSGVAQTLSRLATALSGFAVDTIVVDRTGLNGNFDMELQWTPDVIRSAAAGTPAGDGPSLFTALQEQFGLKLESARGPVDYLVIDSAEIPTAD